MTDPTFRPPPSVSDLSQAEIEILEHWATHGVFQASMAKPAPRGSYVFFEGPPTANNVPHVGHALTRAIKDVLPRFKTMRGHRVLRKAGWDTHGLPVEIAIEKELGFSDKSAIEDYGVQAFNDKCWSSVRRYEREWVKASDRLGYWLDFDDAYFTFKNTYIESVWWILGQMFEQDMLFEGHKVLPYCPLCGTTHSSHEVAQAYQDVKDPSVTIAFAIEAGQVRPGRILQNPEPGLHDVHFGPHDHILAWTTTPWTLPSNLATCVHPEHTYVLAQSKAHPERRYLYARDISVPVEELVDGKPFDLRSQPVIAEFAGKDLEGVRYTPLFDFTGTDVVQDRGNHWTVCVDEYVTLDSGTGVVHMAPAFGEDDHRVGKAYDLGMYIALEPDGQFKDHAGPYAGKWFKDADPEIIGDLKHRGLLVRSKKYEHPYPHCWRHGTPLYYYATSSWFVRTTAMRDDLVANNQLIDWTPSHVKDGRFGKWLDGVVDWALSRKRYWGTPLPIWRCDGCGELDCQGSFEQLFERAGQPLPEDPYDRAQWNPHRPFVDDIVYACASCSGTKRRVPEVIDCWFDAGAMPFAQHHYPFDEEWRERIDSGEAFPADFISEGIDQTRGWFYTLHVIATFLKKSPAYKSCIALGHVLDESGKKMSKSLGNVVAPDTVIDQFGADAFRWFFYRSNPALPSRFGPNMVRESLRSFLLPLLNAWSFFTIYAEIDGFRPDADAPAFEDRAPLDRWVLSELRATVAAVIEHMDAHRIEAAARTVEDFVEGLTNWYIRRSRRRFWKGEDDADKAAAHHTLWQALTTLSRAIAPFVPFLAERMHQDLVRPFDPSAPVSVHLADFPDPDAMPHDDTVQAQMSAAQRVVKLGHAARQDASAGVRQPLARATIVSVDDALLAALRDPDTAAIVRDELNVKTLDFAADRGAYVTYQVKPNFRALGKRVGKQMKAVAAAIGQLDPAATVAAWEAQGRLVVTVDGAPLQLSGDDLDVRIQQREGTTSAYDDSALVALDTALDDALVAEGLAREVISKLQGLRRQRDLDYDDRVAITWDAGPGLAAALTAHAALVSSEVLATAFVQEPGHSGELSLDLKDETFTCSLQVAGGAHA